MPYTPPSQRSPATSTTNSPSISRTPSYSEESALSPRHAARPTLPRSASSTSYLHKHRRSPSINTSQIDATANADPTDPSVNGHTPNGITNSPQNSNDDDRGRRRRSENWEDLQHAVESIELRRGCSPTRAEDAAAAVPPLPTSVPMSRTASPALTPEARKISHSRSSSELTLSTHVKNLPDASLTASDESDAEDDELRIKPPLLRKKSGELVKPALRPTSRRRPSSMPGTPTFSKAVHFNEDIEQVRHFLQVDRPIAVSAGSSPVETFDSESEYPFGYDDGYKAKVVEWEIRLANFPRETFERKTLPVTVDRIFLSTDNKTLVGNVSVANLAFQKYVVVRFTLDYWKTTSEVVAEFNNDVRRKQSTDGRDRFNFNIKLADQANLESKTLLLCVRYNVNGQEFWDNNTSMNFQVDFVKKTKKQAKGGMQAASLGAIPRSKHSPPTAKARTTPASPDDDFANELESKYQFGRRRTLVDDSPNPTLRFKNRRSRGSLFPSHPSLGVSASGQGFSTRYDFGASLSAALSTAQSALGDRSGLKPKESARRTNNAAKTEPSKPADQPSVSVITANASRPDALSSEKPDLKSAEYNELIQKYCFFGSGKSSPQVTPPRPSATDSGAAGLDSSSENSEQNSGSDTPSPKNMSPLLDGACDQKNSTRSSTPFLSRSTSPGPLTGFDMTPRSSSPTPYASQYHQNMHGGLFSDSHTPTAIRG